MSLERSELRSYDRDDLSELSAFDAGSDNVCYISNTNRIQTRSDLEHATTPIDSSIKTQAIPAVNRLVVVESDSDSQSHVIVRSGIAPERPCELCGQLFSPRARDVARGQGRFHSRRCASIAAARKGGAGRDQSGEANHNFKGWASRNKVGYKNRFRSKFPEKAAAHDAVRRAISTRRLVRPACCESCGVPCLVHAHHDDYGKPLDVAFVCRACHRVLDGLRRGRVNAALSAEV